MGVVRCEASDNLPPGEVTALADVTARCSRRPPESTTKTYAPQNLVPIGGLERQLRHRLGDMRLLYRALRQAASNQRNGAAAI